MGNLPLGMSALLISLGVALYIFAHFRRRTERFGQQLNWLANTEMPNVKTGFALGRVNTNKNLHQKASEFSKIGDQTTENFISDFYKKLTQKEQLSAGYFIAEVFFSLITGAFVTLIIVWIFDIFQEQLLSKIILVLMGSTTGFVLMKIVNVQYARHKQRMFERQAPDILDFLILAIETGMTIDRALSEVTESLKLMKSAAATELSRLCKELSILPDRELAFDNLIERTGSKTFRSLKTHLFQGEKYGVPIGKSLRAVAAEARNNALTLQQEKARKLPVFISIPLMLLILPPIVVISTGPGFVQLMRSF